MSDVTIRCRVNGPLVIEGPVTIIDHEGNPFAVSTDKPAIALCRCGQSAKKPFCDGSHRTCGFAAANLATEGSG
ncbi:MAG: CDGSH iron-sulfur domain-containing protein [Planctomycetia bacterium]|nr:CDGSH iron-sulfur domain-containing protein [Planctomycetia bacterium]